MNCKSLIALVLVTAGLTGCGFSASKINSFYLPQIKEEPSRELQYQKMPVWVKRDEAIEIFYNKISEGKI